MQARWQEILLILIVDVPSIIGAAGELVEARGLFRLVIVELGFCVFGKTATEWIERSKSQKKTAKGRTIGEFIGVTRGSAGSQYTQNFRR